MWLVTGGCGFIGSNFIKLILKEKNDIRILNLDKLTYAGNIKNLEDIKNNENYVFVKGDISDTEILDQIFREHNIDLIINFAAESHVDRSINSGDEFIQTNIQGTHTLLKFARKYDCEFIQISTDEVYGSIINGFSREEDKLNPSSIYSASKASAEMLVNAYKTTYGLETKITRSSNNFGPYQYPEKLIPRFITNLLRGKKLPLYGTGKNVRDWIYVEDNCRAILQVIEKGKKGEIYNIGGGNEKTNLEISELILQKLGHSKDMITFVEDRLGHDFRYAINSDKIKKLGWKPKYTFEEAFDLTIKWYKENKEWWEPLLID
ncbi:MAG: dTDP-glucose 4,6-dehydratase [Candidatus Helarchaeota archaeon]